MKPQQYSDNKYLLTVAVFLVFTITFLLYLPALSNGFVNWDDDINVYDNIYIREINSDFLKWAFSTKFAGLWHPLTMFSYAINYSIFGLNPFGYHLTNILIHALNTALVFFVAIRLIRVSTSRQNPLVVATGTALLFGIHPIQVESVVWVTERKGLLCAFFYLLTLLSYFKYLNSKTKIKRVMLYTLSISLFALALMSKPMAVSLPAVLLILDFYPFKRLFSSAGYNIKVFIEKIPFLLLVIGASLITISVQNKAGAMALTEQYPLNLRIMNAVNSYIAYIAKMVFPINLAPYYPFPFSLTIFQPIFLASFIAFISISFFCVMALKRDKPFLFTIWLYYVVTLIPVIGIIKIGGFAMADRYSYLPSIAPFFFISTVTAACYSMLRNRSAAILVTSALIIMSSVLMNKTYRQIGFWKDSITLWSHQIRLFPTEVALPYNNRGIAYDDRGDYQNAIKDYNMAISLDPKVVLSYINRGNDYSGLGAYQKAIEDYNTAIRIDSKYTKAYNNRGNAYVNLSNYHEAIKDYSAAINLDKFYTEAYYNRCNAHINLGNYQEALKDCDMAISLDPKLSLAYYNRGLIFNRLGNSQKATENVNMANKLNAKYGDAYFKNSK